MKRISVLYLILIFSLGLGLRLFNLGDKSLWLDEACNLYLAKHPVPLLIREAFSYDMHPPLYSIFLHYWLKWGENEFTLRLFSVIVSLLSMWVFYKLAAVILDKRAAWLALILFTFSSLLIFFSQEARPYSLFLLEGMLLSYFFMKFPGVGKRYLGLYIFAGLMSVYTHLYAFLLLASHLFYLFFFKGQEKEKQRRLVLAILIILILFLPWWPALSSKQVLFKTSGKGLIFWPALKETLRQFNFGLNIIPPIVGLVLTGLLVGLVVYFFIRGKEDREKIKFLSISLLLPLTAILLYPGRIHEFRVKEVIFLCPFWYILLAWGMGKLKIVYRTMIISIWLLGNIMVLSFYYRQEFIKEDWREAASFIGLKEKEGEAIIFSPAYLGFPFDYYYRGKLPRGGLGSEAQARKLRDRFQALWLIEDTSYLAIPLKQTRPLIESRFKSAEKFIWRGYLGDVVVTKFY